MRSWKQLPWFAQIVIALSVLAGLGVISVVTNKPTPTTPPQTSVACTPDAAQLLSLINQERSKLGAPALALDTSLATSAHNKLADEILGQYYGHNLPDGSSTVKFLRAAGVNASWSEDLNENALNPSDDWTAFKNSPAHYASLTNPQYTRVGIANQCANFVLKTSTGDAPDLVGSTIKELTVVHLAAPEPKISAPAQYVAPRPQVTTCYPAIFTVPAHCTTQ